VKHIQRQIEINHITRFDKVKDKYKKKKKKKNKSKGNHYGLIDANIHNYCIKHTLSMNEKKKLLKYIL